ncbi:uncharacterized protein LOC144164003 isoform X2 [Haemaphysalis longicornis]
MAKVFAGSGRTPAALTTWHKNLCAAVMDYPQVRFGIAVYDVIYDQGHTCPKFQLAGSPFGRVQTLGLVRSLMEDLYDSRDMESCLWTFGSKAEWEDASASTRTDGETGVTDENTFWDYLPLQRAPLQPASIGTTSGKSSQRRSLWTMAKNHRTSPPYSLHSKLVQK